MDAWRALYRLLNAAELDRRGCFFTNVFVGLAAGDSDEDDPKVSRRLAFRPMCRRFFQVQIDTMRPGGHRRLGPGFAPSLDRPFATSSWAATKALVSARRPSTPPTGLLARRSCTPSAKAATTGGSPTTGWSSKPKPNCSERSRARHL